MLKKKSVQTMFHHFQRILITGVNHSTFREMQNIILSVTEGDEELSNKVLQSLVQQELMEGICSEKAKEEFEFLIRFFSIPLRFSREIQERGDMISIITSDLLQKDDSVGFINRIKRIDGNEFHFITDDESTMNLLQHFLTRLNELDKIGKSKETFSGYHDMLKNVHEELGKLLKKYPASLDKRSSE